MKSGDRYNGVAGTLEIQYTIQVLLNEHLINIKNIQNCKINIQ